VKTVAFERVNVFTDQRFSGNPLVVIPDASGLEDQEMQAIAKEMGTSETTFVFPPEAKEATYKVRIFTLFRKFLLLDIPHWVQLMSWPPGRFPSS